MVNQSLSDTHESSTCALGPNGQPCPMCALANEYERRSILTGSDKTALLDDVVQRARDDLNHGQPLTEMRASNDDSIDPEVSRRILRAIDQDQRFASLTVMRAALADVLDAGDPDNLGEWLFCKTESDWQTERRAVFIDAVCARITTLQAPPFNFDAGLRERLATKESQ